MRSRREPVHPFWRRTPEVEMPAMSRLGGARASSTASVRRVGFTVAVSIFCAVLYAPLHARSARAETVPPPFWPTPPSVGLADESRREPPAGVDVTGLPSLSGASGLFHTSTASPVRARQLRLGLVAQAFAASDFLVPGDRDRELARDVVVSYGLARRLEIFADWASSSNVNRRARGEGDVDPEVIRILGNLTIGGKGSLELTPRLALGAEGALRLSSGAADLLWSPSATSVWLGSMLTYDGGDGGDGGARGGDGSALRRLPFRAHVGIGYLLDNSSNLARLSAGSVATREVANFAYGTGRGRVRGTVALDVPLAALVGIFSPAAGAAPPGSGSEARARPAGIAFLEYSAEYVTAGADPTLRELLPPLCATSPTSTATACSDDRSAQRVTLGLRAAIFRDLVAELGIDLVLGSTAAPYGPPLPPHNAIFGLAYPFDLGGPQDRPARRAGEPAAAAFAPAAAVPPARPVLPEAASPAAAPPPGPEPLGVTPSLGTTAPPPVTTARRPPATGLRAPEPGAESVGPPGNGTGARTMLLHGRVTDPTGHGLQAALMVRGPAQSLETTASDAEGLFELALRPGNHRVRVQSPGFEMQELQVDAVAGTERNVEVRLQPPALDPTVQLEARTIKLARPIRFVNDGTELTAEAQLLLKSVAEVLGAHPEISLIRIAAHWDDGPGRLAAQQLTTAQAQAVRAFLIGRGVADSRLQSEGMGASFPLVAGGSAASRARNRRVELEILR